MRRENNFPFPLPLREIERSEMEPGLPLREIERSEMEPGEGAGSHPHVARRPLTRFARRCSLSTLSHDGERGSEKSARVKPAYGEL